MTYHIECEYCKSRNIKYMSGYSDEVSYEYRCLDCDKFFGDPEIKENK